MSNFTPYGPNLLVRPIDPSKVVNGIELPDEAVPVATEGEVLTLGDSLPDEQGRRATDFTVREIVIHKPYAGTVWVSPTQEKLLILPVREVLGRREATLATETVQ